VPLGRLGIGLRNADASEHLAQPVVVIVGGHARRDLKVRCAADHDRARGDPALQRPDQVLSDP
jgi:hypothetical protein